MRLLGKLLPGDYLKTAVYLHAIAKPRRAVRVATHGFYRMELIYDVLREFRKNYQGPFSILECGTADGYAFTKMLYATRYLGMENEVVVHGFDSFKGLPAPADQRDESLVSGDSYVEGQYRGSYEALDAYCRSRGYRNYRLHRGYFEDTLTEATLRPLEVALPILVWIDCNFYSSARTALERLLPYMPSGCVVYFDDYDFNFGSRFTGEARAVDELNRGAFGKWVELVPDRRLSLDRQRVYRFIRFEPGPQYTLTGRGQASWERLPRAGDSPFP
jgi:hypothetical protein